METRLPNDPAMECTTNSAHTMTIAELESLKGDYNELVDKCSNLEDERDAWKQRAEGVKLGNENYAREISNLSDKLAGAARLQQLTFDNQVRWAEKDEQAQAENKRLQAALNEAHKEHEKAERLLSEMRAWYKLTELELANLRSLYEETQEDTVALHEMARTLLRTARHALNQPERNHDGIREPLAEGIARLDAAILEEDAPARGSQGGDSWPATLQASGPPRNGAAQETNGRGEPLLTAPQNSRKEN